MPQTTKPRETKATKQRAAMAKEKAAEEAAKKSFKKPNEVTKTRPLPLPPGAKAGGSPGAKTGGSPGAKAGGRGRPLSSTLSFRPTSTKTSTFQVDASKLQKRGSSNEQFDSKKVGNIKSKAAMRNKAESKPISEERGRIEEPMDTDEEDYSSPAAFGHGTKRFSQTTARTPQTKRILILGKTGNGKSSLGNLILGKDAFTVGKSRMSSCTTDVVTAEGFYHDGPRKLNIEVTDTPDVMTEELRSKQAQLTKLAKNETFDLVLFTVRVDVRFSPEEQQFYKHTKDVFREALTRNLVVAFTFGDMLAGDVRQFTKIPSLQEVLRDAGGRYVVVNNKAKGRDMSAVVGELLQFCGDDDEPFAGATCDAPTSFFKRDSRPLPATTHTQGKVSNEKEEEEDDDDDDKKFNYSDDSFESDDDDRPSGPENKSKLSGKDLSEDSFEKSPAASAPRGPPCVLVIGKTGNGKSSVCNMLLGEKRFKEGRGMSSTTATAQCEQSTSRGAYNIKVVDTPDISETKPTKKRKEVEKWRQLKPDVILLAIRCDVMYTQEEYNIYREICNELGSSYVTSRLIVAFTFGDPQDSPMEDEIDFAGKHLKRVLEDANKRYIVFDKNAKAAQRNKTIDELFTLIKSIEEVDSAVSSMSTLTAQSGQRMTRPLNQTVPSHRSKWRARRN